MSKKFSCLSVTKSMTSGNTQPHAFNAPEQTRQWAKEQAHERGVASTFNKSAHHGLTVTLVDGTTSSQAPSSSRASQMTPGLLTTPLPSPGLRTDSTGSTNASATASPNGVFGLIHLAMHILSIIPNSAATERIFSQFGVIYNKLRNRLDPEKVRKQVLVKSNTIVQHGSLPQRKRKFFAHSDDNSSSEYLSDQYSNEFLTVRDLLEDVQSADVDVRHHFDSDNS